MTGVQHIVYIRRAELNTAAWDQCITTAANGLIYANHEYLDIVCGEWDALVMEDYAAVMPLVWRKKWGCYYLYYPPFCAALGVFGNNLSEEIITRFLNAIPVKFRYWDFPMNPGNPLPAGPYSFTQRTNYILALQPGYTSISKNYRENLQRNIRKAISLNFQVSKGFPVQEVISLAKLFTPNVTIAPEAFNGIEQIYAILHSRNKAITYGIRNEQGMLLASAVFFFDNRRAYYILVGNHPDGKTTGASHALIDAFIKDYAGQDLVLDFEGSEIRNLAFFYSGYGAVPEYYPWIRLNRLPLPVKWLKS